MPTKQLRDSNVNDDLLIMHSEVVHSAFMEHHSKFSAFNPTIFTEDYNTHFRGVIDAALAQTSDDIILQKQVVETKEVTDAVESVMGSLAELKYFVGTAFPKESLEHKQFQLSTLSLKKRNVDTFLGLLADLVDLTVEYQERLATAGYTAEKAAHFKETVDHLRKERKEQKEMKFTRTKLTAQRIEKMNALWQTLTDIKEASEVIFIADNLNKERFALPRKKPSQKHDDETSEEVVAE